MVSTSFLPSLGNPISILAALGGTVLGIALGVITIRFVSSYINFKAMPYYAESLATGALLILVIAIELLVAKYRLRRRP